MKQNHLVISALSADHPGVVHRLSEAIFEAQCNIEESRMTVLGSEFATILLVSGKWNGIAKLEDAPPTLAERHEMQLILRRTESREQTEDKLPYIVDVAALDQQGIVRNLAGFFSGRGINIEDMSTSGYGAAHTGTPMFAVHMHLSIPADTHIAALRDEFLDFADRLNVDAVIEPLKNGFG